MYERILVPLDGSPAAERVLDYVILVPSHAVRLLQVVPRSAATRAAGRRQSVEAERPARDYLHRVAELLAETGRAIETACLEGDPADRIVEAAAEADLIAMTTRGHGAGGRLLYGSVADRVSRHAPVPTLIVHADADLAAVAAGTGIVVPLDGSSTATRAVPIAAALCAALGRTLRLVSVAEPAAAASTTEARRRAQAYLDGVAAEEGTGTVVETDVRSGSPATEIVASLRAGDLIVMTTHGGGGRQRWQVGAVAEQVLRQAPAPVLLVRGDGSVGT